jgi:hypothetical protein
MSKKYELKGTVGESEVTLVDMTAEEMQAEILRLNGVIDTALRQLRSLSNSRHPALEAARFTLTHGGSHRRRDERGGWNTPKKKKATSHGSIDDQEWTDDS